MEEDGVSSVGRSSALQSDMTMPKRHVSRRRIRRCALAFFVASFDIYSLMSYGGVRSPDSEVVFRTGESLATRGTFAVAEELELWSAFGLPRGNNGNRYSIFGPGESVAIVPLIWLAQVLNETQWYEGVRDFIQPSHYVGNGLHLYMEGRSPSELEPHALRFVVSIFNVLASSLAVVCFLLLLNELVRCYATACLVTVLFAFGTPLFPYSGTLFSEPLATLLCLVSLYCLVSSSAHSRSHATGPIRLAIAGLSLGAAILTHITAILFVPFFLFYAMYKAFRGNRRLSHLCMAGLCFGAGVAAALAVLGYYNYARFGHVLETGRTVDPRLEYGWFVAPWNGLYGLLFSPGKGLFLYAPAMLPALFLWPRFYRRQRILAVTLLSAALFRLVFIATRSDWSGGFCLGPRHMLMLMPFLLIPWGYFLRDLITKNRTACLWLFGMFVFACVSEQLYFCLGEVFSFLHIIKWKGWATGANVFENNGLYLTWSYSPLKGLLDGKRGPFLLQHLQLSNHALWRVCMAVAGGALFFTIACLRRALDRARPLRAGRVTV
jgi:hypothetical protein